jgi:hypothetical protein
MPTIFEWVAICVPILGGIVSYILLVQRVDDKTKFMDQELKRLERMIHENETYCHTNIYRLGDDINHNRLRLVQIQAKVGLSIWEKD